MNTETLCLNLGVAPEQLAKLAPHERSHIETLVHQYHLQQEVGHILLTQMEYEHQDNLLAASQSLNLLEDSRTFALLAECLELTQIEPFAANEALGLTLEDKIKELQFGNQLMGLERMQARQRVEELEGLAREKEATLGKLRNTFEAEARIQSKEMVAKADNLRLNKSKKEVQISELKS